jgi:dTDP-glucose pyrophosphorylase
MKAIIMDGGQGARLSPLTSSQAKPTIRIAIPIVALYHPLSIGEAQ